jgi:hypothetical protein
MLGQGHSGGCQVTITLSAEIGGEHVPLTECDWVLWRSCGCPQGVSKAAGAHGVYAADEDAAWKEFYDLKRDRVRAQRKGLRLELMSHERYCHEVSERMKARCPHA